MERMKMSKKGIVWLIISLSLIAVMAGAVVWLTVCVVRLNTQVDNHAAMTENQYQNSLYDTADGLRNVENNLSKLLVARSKTQCTEYATDVCRDAAAAANSASHLPIGFEATAKLEKFLNQVSDFSASYLRTAASGGDLSSYNEQLVDLHKTANALKNQITEITVKLGVDYRISDHLDEQGYFSGIGGGGDTDSAITYPRIIYDGPFSDSIDEDKPYKALEGMPDVSEADAINIAADKLSLTEAKHVGTSGQKTVVYHLIGKINGKDAQVDITKPGGMISSVSVIGCEGGVKYDEKFAREFASDFCRKLGYAETLTPVWYNQIDGVAYVNFAPEVDGVIYYPDLIKVKVCLRSGSLLGFEARHYCMNYHIRPAAYAMNEKAIPSLVSDMLKIKSVRLAIIPKGESEKLCYEVSGEAYGLDYFVYLDAVSGDEIDVQRVIDEDQGKMVF